MDVHTVVVVTIVAALASMSSTGSTTPPTRSPRSSRPGCCPPRLAVLWAAFFNFVALWIFGTGVAKTISGIITIKPDDHAFVWVVLCGLTGAITWNLLTWWWGLPSSSSHALIGGVGGSGVGFGGFKVVVWEEVPAPPRWWVAPPPRDPRAARRTAVRTSGR